jgi:outer membrane receptor protein involved in Fe transport
MMTVRPTALRSLAASALSLAFFSCPGFAQKADTTNVPKFTMKEIVVTATRTPEEVAKAPAAVGVVTSKELEERQPRTAAEALREETGITVQKTNHNGGAPIIRGMMGNQILLMVDGIRLNNAIYRFGPNQYLNTVDPDQISRIEVIRGPGSVYYGSDAMGGVVNVLTRDPLLSAEGIRITGLQRGQFSSTDQEALSRTRVTLSGSRVALALGGTYKDVGNFVAGRGFRGRDSSSQVFPSSWYEKDFDARLVVVPFIKHRLVISVQDMNERDVEFYHTPDRVDPYQDRTLTYVKWTWENPVSFLSQVEFRGSQQVQQEKWTRKTIRSSNSVIYGSANKVKTPGGGLQAKTQPWKSLDFIFGLEAYRDKVTSAGFRDSTAYATGVMVRQTVRGDYGTATMDYGGGFLLGHAKLHNRLELFSGVRYDQVKLTSPPDPLVVPFGFKQTSSALTGGGGVRANLWGPLFLVSNVATAFRAPNTDDVLRFGPVETAWFEVPNANLAPEKSTTVDYGLRWDHPRMAAGLTFYNTYIRDLIDRRNGTYNGDTLYSGRRVQQRQNVGRARINGVEAEVELSLSQSIRFKGGAFYTYGQDLTNGQPLRRIPPASGFFGCRYTASEDRLWGEVVVRMARDQWRYAPGDRSDRDMQPVKGRYVTPGYMAVNLRFGAKLTNYLESTLGIENATNRNYWEHGSRVPASGTSVSFGLTLSGERKL